MAKPESVLQLGVQTFLTADRVQANLRAKAEGNQPLGRKIYENAFAVMQNPAKREEPKSRDVGGFYATRVFRKKNQDGTTTRMHMGCFPYFWGGFPEIGEVQIVLRTRVSQSEAVTTILSLSDSGNLYVDRKMVTYNTRLLKAAGNIVTDIAKRSARKYQRANSSR